MPYCDIILIFDISRMKDVLKMAEESSKYSPIVFLNAPVKSEDMDAIGIDTTVELINSAISSGATMIGLLADYGAGKSSVTDYLGNLAGGAYHSIKINMWDSINKKNNADDISDLSKSLLYQLALKISINDKKSSVFAKHINKRLSRSYGLISFSSSSLWQFILAILCYSIYLLLCTNQTLLAFLINSFSIASILIISAPIFLVTSGVFLVIGIRQSTIAYSYWKDQSKRSQDVNDIFDVYNEIVIKLCNKGKCKHLVIIEDLDRISDKQLIIGLLKELYRFQNLLTDTQKQQIIFIVSLKQEALLESDKSKTDHTFDKLFDYTISLKPLHFEDYESIISNIIKADKDRKKKLEELLGYEVTNKLPDDFFWLVKGHNLTIRNLKDRLNQAIALMVTLKNKNYKLLKSAISFKTCAAVVYLEHVYEKSYYDAIRCEEEIANAIRNSYEIRNSQISDDKKVERIVSSLTFLDKSGIDDLFKLDLSRLINAGILDDDFRMYLYNYPRNIHIKTSDEKDVYNLLMLSELYPNDEFISEKVARIIQVNSEDNIILECINKLTSDGRKTFPAIILRDEYLFDRASRINPSKLMETVLILVPWINDFDHSKSIISKISSFSKSIRVAFYKSYCCELLNVTSWFHTDDIVKIRLCLIDVLDKDILYFKDLFLSKYDEETDYPIITPEEIEKLSSLSIVLDLINTNAIDDNNIAYLANNINKHALIESDLDKAELLFKAILGQVDLSILAPILLIFLSQNNIINIDFFQYICSWIDDDVIFGKNGDTLIDYVNSIAYKIPVDYLKYIDKLMIYSGLESKILTSLEENNFYLTFLCSMYDSKKLAEIDYSSTDLAEKIVSACKQINEQDENAIIAIRLAILQTSYNSLHLYETLFSENFPLITNDELSAFQNANESIDFISLSSISETNYMNITSFANSEVRGGSFCYKLLKYLFDTDDIEESLIASIVKSFDYNNIAYNDMTDDEKDEIAAYVENALELSDPHKCIEFLKLTNSLTPVLEKRITDAGLYEEYVDMINELNLCSDYTVEWINEQDEDFQFGLCSSVTTKLLEKEYFYYYVVGSTLIRDSFEFQPDIIPFETYLRVYINSNAVFDYMRHNEAFLHAIVSNKQFNNLTYSRIMPLTVCRQPFGLLQHAFAILTGEQLEEYLCAFEHLDTKIDSDEYLTFITSENNHQKLNTYLGRRRGWQIIWDPPSNRTKYTRFMKKYYPREIYRGDDEAVSI